MANTFQITVPDIGNFDSVEVIEVIVKIGDMIKKEDSLITVESDKASMDIPSTHEGKVTKIDLKVGDKVKQGSNILVIELSGSSDKPQKVENKTETKETAKKEAPSRAPSETIAKKPDVTSTHETEVLVLGSGPGGYTAAFRAADLGKKVVLIERYSTLGGVCLNVGCIPSKALLHTAKVITDAEETAAHGVTFGKPNIDLEKIRNWKSNDVVGKLTQGLGAMAKQRQVSVVQGEGEFTTPYQIKVTKADGEIETVGFEHCIIAAGSQSTKFPGVKDDPRIMDSTGALELKDIPKRLLIVGGGIIGLEMGTVYDALGSRVSVVELSDGLMQGCDRDLVRPLQKRMEQRFEKIMLNTKVNTIEPKADGIHVNFEFEGKLDSQVYDRVLIAIGRRPNGKAIKAELAGVNVTDQGFIPANKQMRTNVSHIFAIGDIVGQPMLAHKATHEGKVAAEVIAGHKVEFQAIAIPYVAYTDPEVAWAGMTETEAKIQNIEIEKASFPWAASGRALAMNRSEGTTKLIFDKETHRLIGAGITGISAGELIAETVLAIEMGADAHDLGLTIHPHPTLSETVCFAAEVKEGTITDLYIKKR
ncbi:Dihydrolipoamide dehydrogenase [Candidatus Methylopumilus planktonicus]|uniref:Dihydrolipoyl dehydrogenase n=1 Tax=Candidatus Methylopumilus planktonicus TaxID=1581557 RepID=A0A0D6EVY6_9PROT|nr:dihydrolipoyl dehydrogenase [Candidatus Methylopumilus planktonicus]CEZ19860.1 Dihydrolipoamide dehydrogenase [Candidatus Methylopumilus planktonicus]